MIRHCSEVCEGANQRCERHTQHRELEILPERARFKKQAKSRPKLKVAEVGGDPYHFESVLKERSLPLKERRAVLVYPCLTLYFSLDKP